MSSNQEEPRIEVRLCSTEFSLPAYATEGASGLDLESRENITIGGSSFLGVETTIQAIRIPPGFEGQVRPRSGLAAKHGITVLNSPGTIDSDYRGAIIVLMANHSNVPYRVAKGERIAQLVIAPVARARVEAGSINEHETPRGAGGFGSTGK
jgi:dUTP pyrophosphatase